MKLLRSQGFTLTAIAEALNALGVPTKTRRAKWSAKTVQQVLDANSDAKAVEVGAITGSTPARKAR